MTEFLGLAHHFRDAMRGNALLFVARQEGTEILCSVETNVLVPIDNGRIEFGQAGSLE